MTTSWRDRAMTYFGVAPASEERLQRPRWMQIATVLVLGLVSVGWMFDAARAGGVWPTAWRLALGVLFAVLVALDAHAPIEDPHRGPV